MSELLDELPTAQLEYALREGTVGEWLALGPLAAPLVEAMAEQSVVARQLALNSVFADADELAQLPAERATSDVTVAEGVTLQGLWRVVNTLEDGVVDLAQSVATPHAFCAWLYAQVVLPQRMTTALQLTVASPTQLWINGEAVFSYDELPDEPILLSVDTPLDEGTNEILLRVANVGVGDVPMLARLQIPGAAGTVTLPTLLEPVKRRQKLAAVMEQAYLNHTVYSDKQRIVLRWPTDMQMIDALTARLQTPAGRIYGEANPMIQKGAKVDFGEANQFPNGLYEILLQPQFEEYYVQNMRVQRRVPFQIRNGKWSTLYYGDDAERRQEALEDAARHSGALSAEIAKGALGQWASLRHDVIEQSMAQLVRRNVEYARPLLSLLGWVARMGDLPDFPQEIAWALEERAPLLLEELEAASSVMLATCNLLAGQLYAQRTFGDLQIGEEHQVRAESWLLQWLAATAQAGLPHGEGEEAFADALLCLSHLVDLAHSDEVAEMAAAVLDKLAYQIALQSFTGAWGGTQDDANSPWLASARLGPLSGVARLWWGQGAWNAANDTTVALACAESYTLPEIIAAVALDRQQKSWLRRQDAPEGLSSPRRVCRAAYRTGDYLLASMPGEWQVGGSPELWRVTLGPDAAIFGNAPALSSENAAWRQNFWRGSAAPVRVAQWQDVLVVAYAPSEHALLAFSHAYFPVAAFDEVKFANGWALARKGNGYVALTATDGIRLVNAGRMAQREVRAPAHAVWLVQMGRAAQDGAFAEFVERVLAQPLTLAHDVAHCMTLRGQQIAFRTGGSLAGALEVDGVPHQLDDYPHLESLYGGAPSLPAAAIEIAYLEHKMRVDFGAPEMPSAAQESRV